MTGDGNRHKKQPQKKQPPTDTPTPVSSPSPTHPTPPLSPVDRRAPPPTPPPLPRRPPARTIPTTITTPTESGGVLGEARNNLGERGMEGREVEVLIPILHPPAFHPPAPRESTRRPATETEHGRRRRRRRRHRRAGARTHKRQRQKGPESLFMWPRASRRPATPPPPVWVSGPPPRAGPLRARVPARYQSVKCSADRGTAPGNPLGRRRGK